MFGPAFFGKAYWRGAYWGPAGGVVPPEPPAPEVQQPTGGWTKGSFWTRQQTADEVRKERERLGIIPRQRKIITRTARKIEERADAFRGLQSIRAEIEASAEFAAMLQALAIEDAERRMAIAAFAAQEIERRILEAIEAEEDELIELLLIEM